MYNETRRMTEDERLSPEQRDLIQRLNQRIEMLKGELNKIEELIKRKSLLEEKIRWYQGVIDDLLENAGISAPEKRSDEIIPGEFANMSVPNACEEILKRAGRPLTTSELYERLTKGGKRFEAVSPLSSITGPLRRDSKRRFVYQRTGRENVWMLREWSEGSSKEEKEPVSLETKAP